MSADKVRVAVAGDISTDYLHWPVRPKSEGRNWEKKPGIGTAVLPGGALLLADFIRQLSDAEISGPVSADTASGRTTGLLGYHIDADFYPVGAGTKEMTYRVKSFRGFEASAAGAAYLPMSCGAGAEADLIVINDEGNGFRDDEAAWLPMFSSGGGKPAVIYRMDRPLAEGRLWKRLSVSGLENTVVIADADDLREQGINISRCLSWERTVLDFLWQIRFNPELASLACCTYLVVVFGLEGAVYYKRRDGNTEAFLFYDPAEIEDGFRKSVQGDMQGLRYAFAAAVAAAAAQGIKDGGGLDDSIRRGVREGLCASRLLLKKGFGSEYGSPGYCALKIGCERDYISEVAVPFTPDFNSSDPDNWSIVNSIRSTSLDDIATEIVKKGGAAILKHVPVGRFGKLSTVDRAEIESFRSLKGLISEYINTAGASRPLSVAVFGPPGSGKSFGVTEVAESIAPGLVVKLEFNLSQFGSEKDLTNAFHIVRDHVLKGKIPLVFFDEFDSSVGGKLGWLKLFLAPMQDGAFRDGEQMHPIGKTIFVFAGGTSSTFQSFCGENVREEQKEAWTADFRNSKGPDFISRLRGHVNIMGPNPVSPSDDVYIIRRAMLFRSLLERKARQLIDASGTARIAPGVLKALLKVPFYKHGARSMEAVIDMSMLSGHSSWEHAYLPMKEQLSLHVDGDLFIRLALVDVLLGEVREKLARQIHENYLKSRETAAEADDPALRPWDLLPENLKESCRRQADHISLKLKAVGYGIMPCVGGKPAIKEFSAQEAETMAEMEHKRFVEERIADKWTYGPVKDIGKKISPYLVPWEELSEDIKRFDRQPVREIPALLAAAGFELYRIK